MEFSWSNFVTIIEVFVAELVFLFSFPKRKLFFVRLFGIIAVAAVAVAFIPDSINTDLQWLSSVYRFSRYMALFLVSVFSMWFCFETGFSPVLSACASGYALQHVASKVAQLLNNTFKITNAFMGAGMEWLPAYFLMEFCIFPFVYAIGALIFGRIAAKNEIYKNSSSLLNVLSVVMIISCLGLNRISGNDAKSYYAIAMCLFALIVQIATHKSLALREENKIITQLIMEERKRYNQSKANIELINIKAHDLKNKLNSMQGKLTPEEIADIRKTVEIYDRNIETGSEILDTIFTERSSKCQENDIQISCLGDGSQFSFMSTMDVYALFSNALDNAIESVLKIPEKEKRIVSMVIENHGGYISTIITNYYEGVIKEKDGLPVTTKEGEYGYHGFGMKSMKLIVEKYGGVLNYTTEGGKFNLNILLEKKENAAPES